MVLSTAHFVGGLTHTLRQSRPAMVPVIPNPARDDCLLIFNAFHGSVMAMQFLSRQEACSGVP
jgi:hypothetical protein